MDCVNMDKLINNVEIKLEKNFVIKEEILEFEKVDHFLEDLTNECQENKHSVFFFDGIIQKDSLLNPIVKAKESNMDINDIDNNIDIKFCNATIASKSKLPELVQINEVNNHCFYNFLPTQDQKGPVCEMEKKPFLCNECDYSSRVKDNLERHINRNHEEERAYKCTECTYSFSAKYGLSTHVRSVHEKIKPFKCNECAYTCSVKSSLTLHINSIHVNLKPFKCSDCDYSCYQKCTMVKHVQSAVHKKLKSFLCSDCGSSFCNKISLISHIKEVHKLERPYLCSECNNSFTMKSRLLDHVQSVHEKLKPFKCTDCAYTCSMKKSLTQHHNLFHSIKCSECPYSCSKKSILLRHIICVHECKKLKPLQWKNCDYKFGQENVLAKFPNKVKGTTTDLSSLSSDSQSLNGKINIFKCSECDYSCRVRGSLLLHIKLVHTHS